MKLGVCVMVGAVALAACAPPPPVWIKPGATQDDFSKDKYACLQQSQQPASSAYVGRYGGYADSGIITNGPLFGACMNSRGWYVSPVADNKGYSEALRPIAEQQRQACSSSEFQVLFSQKMACKPADTNPQQLADRSKISSEEKAALLKWKMMLDETNTKIAEIDRQYNHKSGEAMASLIERNMATSGQLISQLVDGRLTWGEYNRRRLDNFKRFEEEAKIALATN